MEAFGTTTTIDSIITQVVNGQATDILMPTITANTLRFAGQVEDQETGTFYNYFRDYDSSTGRYVQSDPIGLIGGMNTFNYAGGNPLTKFDHYGHTAQSAADSP